MRRWLIPLAFAAAALGGCALFSSGDRRPAPEPAYAPSPPPPMAPPAPMAPAPPEMETGAAPATERGAPEELDRGLPVCPGDPRCKKSGPG